MQLYFYADEESIELLVSARPKALLIGGDFGYGNFGDVLQHVGSARHIKEWSGLATASVFSLDALSRHVDAHALRRSYPIDALLFVAETPVADDEIESLGLRLVTTLENVSFVHLYGGGYLNEMWGDFVLGVVGHFLEKLPGVPYVISGQQLSPGYVQQARAHVEAFSPRILGMRDHASLGLAHTGGIHAEFSFDDAVEPLLELREKLELREGDGAFIHLNSSGYTGNDETLSEMLAHLRDMASCLGGLGQPVLLQAFQDARETVVDSIETVKRLETGFPFHDIETIFLVHAILNEEPGGPRVLQGRFGYSSSYHVTLWLQLNGIPCWLRGSNDYYTQKREALGIRGGFGEFMERMPRPDHGENLRARSLWLSKLQHVLEAVQPAHNRIELTVPDPGSPTRVFHFKGEPRIEARLNETWAAVLGLKEENERLVMQMNEEQDAVAPLKSAAAERDVLRGRLDAMSDVMEKRISEHSTTTAQLLEATDSLATLRAEIRHREGVESDLAERLGRTEAQSVSLRQELDAAGNQLLDMTGLAAALKAEIRHREGVESDLARRLGQAEALSESLQRDMAVAGKREALLSQRMNGFCERLTALGTECRIQERRAGEAEANWHAVREGNERLSAELDNALSGKEMVEQRLGALESRLAACNEQLTAIGGEARRYRESAEHSHASLLEVEGREREAVARLQEAMHSRSWRWTRPARVIVRYFRTGRFDPAGDIGLFEMSRIIGRKIPMPASWRSGMGRWLQKMRRH